MFDFSWSNILHSNVINFAIMIAFFAYIIKKLNVGQKIEDMRVSIQQKVEEYFSHKKIRKEYKKISTDLIGNFTLSPLEQKDFLMFVPIENKLPLIKTNSRKDENNIYNEYHQL